MTESARTRAVVGAPAAAPRVAPPDYAGSDQVAGADPTPGVLSRIKLSEPVRLYLYSVIVVLVAGLNLAGILTGDWQAYAISSAAVVLAVGGGAEAARASVYSPASTIGQLLRVRRAADLNGLDL